MKRIAVIDLLFNWPPDGGARTDVMEICSRLAQHAAVTLFVPDYTRYFKRGRISGDLPFPVEKLPFSTVSFNSVQVGKTFYAALERFRPDSVYIADGWYLKPRLVNALADFRPWLRFYAYETLCLRGHGTFMRKGKLCTQPFTTPGLTSFLRCQSCAIRHIVETRYLHFFQEYLFSGAWMPSYRRAVESMLRNAAGIIVYNRMSASLVERYNKRVKIIPSGVDVERFPFRADRLRDEKKDGIVIGMAGRITDSNKGFATLLQATDRLIDRGYACTLLVTAEISSTLSRSYMRAMPWMTQEELPGFYEACDICVVPSIWPEPFGIVALEAMASGRPVIVTRVGGLQDIVEDGKTGLLVEPGDAEGLSEALVKLIRDSDLRHRLRIEARKIVEERYTWDHIVDRHYLPLWID